MLTAVPAMATIAINEMIEWEMVRSLAARERGGVSVGLKATLGV